MRRYLMGLIVLVSAFLVCIVSSMAMTEEEETQYSWGVVKIISPNQITITEYDYYSDEEIDFTYNIDKDAEIINVESIKDIKTGESVEIDYIMKNNKRFVKILAVIKSEEEEEEIEKDNIQETEQSQPSDIYEGEQEYSSEE